MFFIFNFIDQFITMSLILTIDSGNTQIKAGLFKDGHLVSCSNMTIEEIIEKYPDPSARVMICSVSREKEIFDKILKYYTSATILDSTTPVPVKIHYETPHTLGMDRLAATVGASYLKPGKSCLIIDAGTCITYDLVDEKGNYYGGGISPGLSIRFKSLHSFTARLPLISWTSGNGDEEIELTGRNTTNSILSGVLVGAVAEIEGIVQRYKIRYQELEVFLCGGDSSYFESKIKPSIFAVPELVHWGLYRIVKHNES